MSFFITWILVILVPLVLVMILGGDKSGFAQPWPQFKHPPRYIGRQEKDSD